MRRKFIIPYIRALPDRFSLSPTNNSKCQTERKLTNLYKYANSNHPNLSVIRDDWHVKPYGKFYFLRHSVHSRTE